LEHPGYFGNQEDVVWRLAPDLPGALVLAQCREQHELALQIHLRLKRDGTSVADLAVRFHERGAAFGGSGNTQLWRNKLAGRVPARAEDLTLWSWLTGVPRKTYPLLTLVEAEILEPRFPPAH
jgi:hypothetical protein